MKVAHVPLDGTIPIYICGADMDSMGYEEKAMKLKWECGGVSEKEEGTWAIGVILMFMYKALK